MSAIPIALTVHKNTPPAQNAQSGAADPGGIIADGVTLTVNAQGIASAIIPAPPAGGLAQIAKVTAAADTSQVSIAAIPNTFSHLQLLALFPQRGANGGSGINLQFNADSTNTHYAWQCIIGANNNPPTSQAAGFTDSSINIGQLSGNDNGANAVACVTLLVVGYASLTTGKGVTGLNYSTGNAGSSQTFTIAGQYLSLSAITSIQVNAIGGANIKAGSVLTLYGLN